MNTMWSDPGAPQPAVEYTPVRTLRAYDMGQVPPSGRCDR